MIIIGGLMIILGLISMVLFLVLRFKNFNPPYSEWPHPTIMDEHLRGVFISLAVAIIGGILILM